MRFRVLLAVALALGAWLLCAGAVSATATAAARPRALLQEVRLSATDQRTRITVALSPGIPYRFSTLERPRRAVLDLPTAGAVRGLRVAKAAGLASGVRVVQRSQGGWRVIVEMTEGVQARASRLARGEGVVIELRAGTARAAAGGTLARARGGAAAGIAPSDAAMPAAAAAAPGPRAPVRAAHAPLDSGRAVIVAVDAGHGGNDPGAIGPGGAREKDVVLGIARDLAARINREPGMRAVLTRDGDYFLTLRQRIGRARAAKADMFVSVHADSVRDPGVSGASVYVLSEKGATDEQARWLAERENAADLKGGVSLDDKDGVLASVLLDLTQSATVSASMTAAERVLQSIDGVGVVRKPRVQQAGFVVLKSPDIPSMLIETAYISNPADERRLRQDEHRERLAQAIFAGVRGYFEDHPPEGTRFALERRGASPAIALAR